MKSHVTYFHQTIYRSSMKSWKSRITHTQKHLFAFCMRFINQLSLLMLFLICLHDLTLSEKHVQSKIFKCDKQHVAKVFSYWGTVPLYYVANQHPHQKSNSQSYLQQPITNSQMKLRLSAFVPKNTTQYCAKVLGHSAKKVSHYLGS